MGHFACASRRLPGTRSWGIALVLAALAGHTGSHVAAAAWVHLSDSTVWDEVGVHYNFRLVLTDDAGTLRSWVIDCRSRSGLEIGVFEHDRERLIDASWFAVRDGSVGEQVSEYVCALRHERRPGERWLSAPTAEDPSKQWSQVGEHLNFRLTYLSFPNQPGTEIWLIDCKTRSTKRISSVAPGDHDTLVNHRWRSIAADTHIIRYACGTYRG